MATTPTADLATRDDLKAAALVSNGFLYVKGTAAQVYVLNQLTGTKRKVNADEIAVLKAITAVAYAVVTVPQANLDKIPLV